MPHNFAKFRQTEHNPGEEIMSNADLISSIENMRHGFINNGFTKPCDIICNTILHALVLTQKEIHLKILYVSSFYFQICPAFLV